MSRIFLHSATILSLLLSSFAVASAPPPAAPPPPKGYRTVSTAITTTVRLSAPPPAAVQPAYLGLHLEKEAGKLIVDGVDADSPAAKARIKERDVLLQVGGKPITSTSDLAKVVRAAKPGDSLDLLFKRKDKETKISVKLAAISRPLTPGQRAILGVQTEVVTDGIKFRGVTPGGPADKAKLKAGDILVEVEGQKVTGPSGIGLIASRRPGDTVKIKIKRAGKTFETKATLASDGTGVRGRGRRPQGWDTRRSRYFRQGKYKLAVVAVEFSDTKHNDKIATKDWEKSLFSKGVYTNRSATGQRVYGSMNDFYLEQSCGALTVTGKVFDWVKVAKKRSDYTSGNRYAMFTEALEKLRVRDGKKALEGYDGIFFLYAGPRYPTQRGGIYWPHRSTFSHQGKRWDYFICPEGGTTMFSISVISHEFGHMLGFPDLYAKPETPGSEGLGNWCTMSTGHGQQGRPMHLSAWCKEQIGWVKPAVIDPRVKQKLVLSPITNSTKECYKVLLRPDGSEYLLLENRVRKGFDKDLPAEGMLIWRVVDGKVALEESHGVAGPAGPMVFPQAVPYPSSSNNAFTPLTTPSSKAKKGDGWEVSITNIKRLPDGRILFQIGYDYL